MHCIVHLWKFVGLFYLRTYNLGITVFTAICLSVSRITQTVTVDFDAAWRIGRLLLSSSI